MYYNYEMIVLLKCTEWTMQKAKTTKIMRKKSDIKFMCISENISGKDKVWFGFMVFIATFNNISVIS